MSFFTWVDSTTDKLSEWGEGVYSSAAGKVGDIKEYFTGDDESVAGEVGAVPGSNAATQERQSGTSAGTSKINWSAIGVGVSAVGILLKVMK